MWDLIVSVPDHCLSFTLLLLSNLLRIIKGKCFVTKSLR